MNTGLWKCSAGGVDADGSVVAGGVALAAKPFLCATGYASVLCLWTVSPVCHWLCQCDSARAWHLDCSHRHGILDGGAIRSLEAPGNLAYIEKLTHPHRKQVRHYEQARHLQELTFSCYKRKPLLTNDVWRKILAAALTKACLEEQFRLIAFVFMPEHVHLLVLPENPQSKVSRLLARTKQPASKQIRVLM